MFILSQLLRRRPLHQRPKVAASKQPIREKAGPRDRRKHPQGPGENHEYSWMFMNIDSLNPLTPTTIFQCVGRPFETIQLHRFWTELLFFRSAKVNPHLNNICLNQDTSLVPELWNVGLTDQNSGVVNIGFSLRYHFESDFRYKERQRPLIKRLWGWSNVKSNSPPVGRS